jgi:hypothetical protein
LVFSEKKFIGIMEEKNKSFGITCLSAANTFDDDKDEKHKGVFGFTVTKGRFR